MVDTARLLGLLGTTGVAEVDGAASGVRTGE